MLSLDSTHCSTHCPSHYRHGDMLYLQERQDGLRSEFTDTGGNEVKSQQDVEEDEVDRVLSKMDGRIVRKKDSQL